MNRAHLIARTLRGQSIQENVVPLYARPNQSDMAKIENQIRRRLGMGQRVYYFIKPEYIAYSDIPIGLNYYIKSYYMSPMTRRLEANVDSNYIRNVP